MCWNWEGKRSQYNYIGNLLREVECELMDASIHAIKDGDWSRGFLVWRKRLFGDDNEKSEKSDVSFPAWAILGDHSFVGHEAMHGIRCNVFVLIDSYKCEHILVASIMVLLYITTELLLLPLKLVSWIARCLIFNIFGNQKVPEIPINVWLLSNENTFV